MSRSLHRALLWTLALGCLLLTGCFSGPVMLAPDRQRLVDHKDVEYPTGLALKVVATGLTAPTAIAFDNEGTLYVAESGIDGSEPRIYGWKSSGTFIEVYPKQERLTIQELFTRFRLYGPIGGMLAHQGRLYISHRDINGRGMITALGLDGSHQTVVGDLPAQGDYGVTDMAISDDGRLYFGVGTATNSGVVGPDNEWAKQFPEVCDQFAKPVITRGPRFDTPNPNAGLGQPDLLVTSPLQPLGQANQTRIKAAVNGKPNGAIYSVSPTGGDLRIFAYGIHNPRGLRFNEWGGLYITNRGMELRGTRPIKNDPDAFLYVPSGAYFGWPDYSADLRKITEPIFQPPIEMIIRTGYREVSFVIDHQASGLLPPDPNTLLFGRFDSQSGAAKFDFVPSSGPFKAFRGPGAGAAIVALSGDRAPFATSGLPLVAPIGYKLMRVDLDSKQAGEFIRNTRTGPASLVAPRTDALERPIDVKFGPDGAMYILDFGRMEMRTATPRITRGTGRIYKLVGATEAAASLQ